VRITRWALFRWHLATRTAVSHLRPLNRPLSVVAWCPSGRTRDSGKMGKIAQVSNSAVLNSKSVTAIAMLAGISSLTSKTGNIIRPEPTPKSSGKLRAQLEPPPLRETLVEDSNTEGELWSLPTLMFRHLCADKEHGCRSDSTSSCKCIQRVQELVEKEHLVAVPRRKGNEESAVFAAF